MGRTVDNIDAEALDEAEKLLGTKGSQDTVNAALRDVVRRRLVTQFFDRLEELDPKELDQVQAEAWR